MNKSSSAGYWVLFIVVAMALACLAQELKPDEVLDGTATAAKKYLRDTTELPLRVATTTSEYDAGGKLRKTRRDSHSFHIVQARPDEYKASTSFGMGSMVFHHANVMEQIDADMTAVVAGMLLRPDLRDRLEFTISPGGMGSAAVVHYRTRSDCAGFEVKGRHVNLKQWCGSGEYEVDASDFTLRRFAFEAAGAPMIEGKRLRAYRLDETFQSVSVASDQKPFVLPKTIIAVYEREDGKTVLTSDFSLQARK